MRAVARCAILLAISLTCFAQNPTNAIKVDQVGYKPGALKIAVVTEPAKTFTVKRAADGAQLFEGQLGTASLDPDTGDRVQAADFSNLRESGEFFLDIPGVGRSAVFKISPDVYVRTFYLAARGFYGQRCGTAVDLGPEFPGYSHPACHKDGRFDPSSGKQGQRETSGGWHDAGDYGRYMPTSGISTGSLLWAYELFAPKLRNAKLNIPETGNRVPDILNEARWNLAWMLKMQDGDGGVWHKQTSVEFSAFVMPQEDKLASVIVGTGRAPFKSTCATADLAAVAAIAARVYAPFDKVFAEQNLKAAQASWNWTVRYPEIAFKNPPGISTGEYGDSDCSDERLWAAAELWRTTGNPDYNRYFVENYSKFVRVLRSAGGDDWSQLAPLALWTYALAAQPGTDRKVQAEIRATAVAAADAVVARTKTNSYHTSLGRNDYIWGSNGIAAGYGRQLLIANALAPNPEFVDAALDNLHYLLGRNTFGLSWVTQVGSNPYRHPHHRPSGSDRNPEPWPGLLSGGPNAGRQDAVLKKLPDLPPAKLYVDDQQSYASNEIAINWQAALVFLLAGVM
jgi:endoglucanase